MARYALVIGISRYDNFRNLDKAATDAAAIARILQSQGQYQVEPLPKQLIEAENRWELAIDKKLTGKDLGQSLETFLLERAKDQEALIYFAGHGFEVPGLGRKKKGYLATSDATADGRNAILFSDLNDLIRESSLSSLVLILDCCHAGSFLERTMLESTLTAFKEKKDYYLITACRGFERAREGEEHGVFTAAVLKGLQPDNADSEGSVTGDRLFDFVQRELRQSGQEPIRTGTGRSITLVSYQTQATTVTAIVDEHGEIVCPYQGLQAFTAKQREFFFGRKRIVEAIKQKLEQQPFVPVIGASGSGKSSVVRAGLMPWLEESGWCILEPIKPGFEPLVALRGVFEPFFKRSRSDIQTLRQLISQDATGLSGMSERLPGDRRYLLVVDQFEEVFTVCADEAERNRFIELITQATDLQDFQLAIVTTMRADFLEPCLHYSSLHHQIQTQAVYMPPLTGVNLRDAITEPAKRQGYTVEDALLLQILEDVGKEPGFLPLLEFTLTKLWEKRDKNKYLLTLEQYEKLGGLTGTLNLHAEQVYQYRDYEAEFPSDKRNQQEQEWIKQIFLRLVRTGEGEKDTRLRQPKGKLFAIAGDDLERQDALRELLDGEDGLVKGRLLVTGKSGQADWVDLVHETLMIGWQRYGSWRQGDRDLRRISERIEDAFREWQKNPKDQNLMMGGLLSEAQENWQKIEFMYDDTLKEFYKQSCINEQKQTATLRRGTEAFVKEHADKLLAHLPSENVYEIAQIIWLAGLSLEVLQGEIPKLVYLCLQKVSGQVHRKETLKHLDSVYTVAISPSTSVIASGGADQAIHLWDIQGNPSEQIIRLHSDFVKVATFSPDGNLIISGSNDGTISILDSQGCPVRDPFQAHDGTVLALGISPNGQIIVSAGDDGNVYLWNLEGELIKHPFQEHNGFVLAVSFSLDGNTIISAGDDGSIYLWDLHGKVIKRPFRGHEAFVVSMTINPDRQVVASGSADGTIRFWNLQNEAITHSFKGHEASVVTVSFSPDRNFLISGSADKTLRLWDLEGNPIGEPFKGHEGPVLCTAFSPDNQFVVSGSSDNTVRFWNLRGEAVERISRNHEAKINSVAFSPDSQMIASGGDDSTIRLWNLNLKQIGQPIQREMDSVASISFSPCGQLIASGSRDWTLRLWNLQGEQICPPCRGHEGNITGVLFSPEGHLIASSSYDGTIRLWSLRGEPINTFSLPYGEDITCLAFSPNGKLIISGSADGLLCLWNLKGELVNKYEEYKTCVTSVAFSPDGSLIASSDMYGVIDLKNLRDSQELTQFRQWRAREHQHTCSVNSLAFSPDGQLVISGGSDSTVQLWDLQGNPVGAPLLGHHDSVCSVACSPDGQWIVSGSSDSTLRIWRCGWKTWLQDCCSLLRHHPVFNSPQTDIDKVACETCQKYIWSHETHEG